ncbi:hypothetical protein F9K50_01010 [bacterium]|nr:MAG: hypothetical protein F9K50_01010 [bacterium]
MTPPVLSNQHCSPEIRANPLPGDRCADMTQPYFPPERRFRMLSVNVDFPLSFSARSGRSRGPDAGYPEFYRLGAGALFRPIPWLGLGAQLDSNWAFNELNLLGRVQGSIPLHRYGMLRLDLAALAGLRQLFGQPHELGGGEANVSGSLFAAGGHASFNIQLTQESSIFPYFRFLISPAAGVTRDADGSAASLPLSWELQFGVGWSLDFLPSGI